MGAFSTGFGRGMGSQGSTFQKIINAFAFWSKQNNNNVYASLEDGTTYFSLTEKD